MRAAVSRVDISLPPDFCPDCEVIPRGVKAVQLEGHYGRNEVVFQLQVELPLNARVIGLRRFLAGLLIGAVNRLIGMEVVFTAREKGES